ncbi:unnamed protein product [Anisakis simplex]|uniref:Uncharacterized protein n=1 Tax=Anisakis simplex TaxID=6269 RepID=A0A0M3J3X8_ANISI|nr:unnamed protein product [Anisakis simplex]
MVTCLFDKVLHSEDNSQNSNGAAVVNGCAQSTNNNSNTQTDLSTSIQKLWKKLNSLRLETQPSNLPQPLTVPSMTAIVCQLYQKAILTLTTLHSDILAGSIYRFLFDLLLYSNNERNIDALLVTALFIIIVIIICVKISINQ